MSAGRCGAATAPVRWLDAPSAADHPAELDLPRDGPRRPEAARLLRRRRLRVLRRAAGPRRGPLRLARAVVLPDPEPRPPARLDAATANLSQGMQWLHGTYAQWFNRRHGLTGHLFDGRFHSKLVDEQRVPARRPALHRDEPGLGRPLRPPGAVALEQPPCADGPRTGSGLARCATRRSGYFGVRRDVARWRYQRFVLRGPGAAAAESAEPVEAGERARPEACRAALRVGPTTLR